MPVKFLALRSHVVRIGEIIQAGHKAIGRRAFGGLGDSLVLNADHLHGLMQSFVVTSEEIIPILKFRKDANLPDRHLNKTACGESEGNHGIVRGADDGAGAGEHRIQGIHPAEFVKARNNHTGIFHVIDRSCPVEELPPGLHEIRPAKPFRQPRRPMPGKFHAQLAAMLRRRVDGGADERVLIHSAGRICKRRLVPVQHLIDWVHRYRRLRCLRRLSENLFK